MKNRTAICWANAGRVFPRIPIHYFRSLLLSMMCAACLGACDSRDAFDYWNDRDYFLEGDEFSVTVCHESGVSVSGWMAHGSGYRAREQYDYWRVTWRVTDLKQEIENRPTNVTYLGRYEAKHVQGTSAPVSESGLKLEMSDFTGRDHLLVWKDGRYLSPKLPITGKVEDCVERSSNGKTPTLFTASRRHMLIWDKPLAICDTHDLKIVREIAETEAVAKLRRLHDSSVGTHHTSITDDLRYLCVIPHNGNDAPTGHNHHRVWGYDTLEDRFFEKTIKYGSGRTAVEEVQSWEGRPYFFVYSETQELGIFDMDQKMIAQIPADVTHVYGIGTETFWRPAEQTVWIPQGQLHMERSERRIELNRFNYSDNTTTLYKLNAGKLRVP